MDNFGYKELVLIFLSTMSIVAGAAITPTLPALFDAFSNYSEAELLVKMLLTSTALGVVVGAPFTGYLMDKSGRRGLLIVSMLIYGLSGLTGLFLNSLFIMLIFRFILGISVSGVMTASTALIADYYHGIFRSRMMGYSGAMIAFGGMVSVYLSGVLTEFGWRTPFILYLPTFVLLIGVILYIDEPEIKHKSDMEFQYPIKAMLFAYIVIFIIQGSFYLVPLQLPFYMNSSINASATLVGLAISISNLFGGMISVLFRRIKDRINYEILYFFIFASMGSGYYVISIADSYLIFIVGLILMGLGLGISMPVINLWLVEKIPEQSRGRVLGGLTASYFLGRFFSPLIVQPFVKYGYSALFQIDSVILLAMSILSPLILILFFKNSVVNKLSTF